MRARREEAAFSSSRYYVNGKHFWIKTADTAIHRADRYAMWSESCYFAILVSKNDCYRLRKRINKCWSSLLVQPGSFPGKRTEVLKSSALYPVRKLASGRNRVRTQVSDGVRSLKWRRCRHFCLGCRGWKKCRDLQSRSDLLRPKQVRKQQLELDMEQQTGSK